jgi:hypothetical protein
MLVLLPQLALADVKPDNQELGALQAVFDFCGKVDSQQRPAFEAQADGLFRHMTKQQATTVRASGAYKQGYQTLTKVLGEMPKSDALPACKAISGSHTARDGWEPRERQ